MRDVRQGPGGVVASAREDRKVRRDQISTQEQARQGTCFAAQRFDKQPPSSAGALDLLVG
jgi:hypothetical protein